MRRILIEQARRKKTLRQAESTCAIELDAAEATAPAQTSEDLALDEALTKLATSTLGRPLGQAVQTSAPSRVAVQDPSARPSQ